MKLFLSFAEEDLAVVLKLNNRLLQQGFEIWDYSDQDDRIPVSENISRAIASRIDDSDFVIALVTDNSVGESKTYTHYEVDYSYQSGKRILPLVICEEFSSQWKGSYEILKDKIHLQLQNNDDKNLENCILDLCFELNVKYYPDLQDPIRLPIYEKTKQEFFSLFDSLFTQSKRAVYREVVNICTEFVNAYRSGDWQKSIKSISYLQFYLEANAASIRLYYPLIIKGTCELLLERFVDGEITFNEAVNHSKCDENAYGGLAQIYFYHKRTDKALYYFQKALNACLDKKDIEIKINLLVVSLVILDNKDTVCDGLILNKAYEIVDRSDWLQDIDIDQLLFKDKLKVLFLLGTVYFVKSDLPKALETFSKVFENNKFHLREDIFDKTPEDISTLLTRFSIVISKNASKRKIRNDVLVINDNQEIYEIYLKTSVVTCYDKDFISYYSYILTDIGNTEEAIVFLQKMLVLTEDVGLYHQLALLYIACDRLNLAVEIYEQFLCEKDLRYKIEYALLQKQQEKPYKKYCYETIRGFPQNCRDWYYQGYAYFLLDNGTIAQHYYERSSQYAAYYT